MSDDQWAEAWSQLTTAVESAYAAGMTEEEILETVEEAKPSSTDQEPRQPKRKKKSA